MKINQFFRITTVVISLLMLITLTAYGQSTTSGSVFNDPAPLEPGNLKRVKQQMVAPPALPEHDQIASDVPVIVEVELIIEEKKIKIDNDAALWAMTFNGTVPGPAIVAHEGDYVEVTLVNPSTNALKHNVDFHAATGAMGGGDLTFVSPGEQAKIRFRATKSGVFYYHCAPGGMMNPSHIVAGMNGTIIILPRKGLKDEHDVSIRYDKAFYITEQDYYIPKDENGNYIDYDNIRQTFADYRNAMMTLMPTHVVFNGAVGALSGNNALTAKVGEKVLFITTALPHR